MDDLGLLQKVNPRDAWPHEAHDFTPWLMANAQVLGAVLGMDLELHAAEHSVGDFSLDLIGVDLSTGEKVIVENQLEKSDHGHLGQLLTYAGGTNPANVVWIADEFRPEHRAALDWLNERTDELTRFFAVEVSAVRIGDSPIAPLFELIVQPNDWEKEVRAVSAAGRSPRQEKYREFWQEFLDAIHVAQPDWTNTKKPLAQNWMNLPAGSSAYNYSCLFSKDGLRVVLYFGSSDSELNVTNFERLRNQRSSIEANFGQSLLWEEMPDRKACVIAFSRPGVLDDEPQWPEYAEWFVENVTRLRLAFDAAGGLSQLLTTD